MRNFVITNYVTIIYHHSTYENQLPSKHRKRNKLEIDLTFSSLNIVLFFI